MSMLTESAAATIIAALPPGPPAPDYRMRLSRLLWELWRDGLMSEQQCAHRLAVDLVTMRRILDMYALGDGHSDRMAAQIDTDALDSREFYELMQAYRCAPHVPVSIVVDAFEAVKRYARGALATIGR